MDVSLDIGLFFGISTFAAAICIMGGAIGCAMAEGKIASQGLDSIAKQPDERGNIVKTMFIAMAFTESNSIYCFVVTMIILFGNPFLPVILKSLGI
jgi:F-type H+-transporting ATPase subunit c